MNAIKILGIVSLLLAFSACKPSEIDDERPVIDSTGLEAFPNNCDTIYIGETFLFNTLFTDNAELGSYSIDIHNNFDHHSHSTEVSACELSPKKLPLHPYVFIHEYEIQAGQQSYHPLLEITVPDNGYDEGDYHFFISLTDREGWRTEKGISVKMLRRDHSL